MRGEPEVSRSPFSLSEDAQLGASLGLGRQRTDVRALDGEAGKPLPPEGLGAVLQWVRGGAPPPPRKPLPPLLVVLRSPASPLEDWTWTLQERPLIHVLPSARNPGQHG